MSWENLSIDNRFRSMFQKYVEYVLKTCSKEQFNLMIRTEVSWRHLCKTSWRRFEKRTTFWRCLEEVSAKHLQDVLARSLEDVLNTSWRRLLKTCDNGEYIRLDQDVLKTSWRRPLKMKTKGVFKMSSRRLHQNEFLLGRNKWTINKWMKLLYLFKIK